MVTEAREKESPVRRWGFAGLMAVGIAINYIDRVNISHAIVPISTEFSLSTFQQGVILSAFSWGYVVFMAVGGLLVDRIGPMRAAPLSAVVWSMSTLWTGLASTPGVLICSRLAVGAGEAPIFPANARLVREFFSLQERGRATAIFDMGSYIGTALAAPMVVWLIISAGWRWSFLACAFLGFIWVLVWFWSSNWLLGAPSFDDAKSRPFSVSASIFFQLLSDRRVIGASIGFFCYNYIKNFFLTWFPSYLIRECNFTLAEVGVVGVLPPLGAVGGELCAGWATDRMVRKGMSMDKARKLPLCLGLLLSSAIAFTTLISSHWAIISLMSFSFMALIAASPGIWTIPGDISPQPEMVGTVGGIQNTFANLAGIIAPIVTGALVGRPGGFGIVFVLSALLAVVGAISYWSVVRPLRPIIVQTASMNTI